MNTLSKLEIRSSSRGYILTIAHVLGRRQPFYFATDDLEVIRKGLEVRHVNLDNGFLIDDRRVPQHEQRIAA